MNNKNPERKSLKKLNPFSITFLYAITGILWVTLSTPILHLLISNPRLTMLIEIIKGWIFVAVTSLLLYYLIRRSTLNLLRSETELLENFAALETAHKELAAAEEGLQEKLLDVKENEARFRRIFEGVSSAVLLQEPSGMIQQANRAARKLLRLNPVYTNNNNRFWISPLHTSFEDGTPLQWEDLPRKIASSHSKRLTGTLRIDPPKRRPRYFTFRTNPIYNPTTMAVEEIVTTLEDITEIHEVDRYETVIKELDHLVLGASPLNDVFNALCRRAVSVLGYTVAAIGFKDPDGSVSFPFKAGDSSEILDQLSVRWDETPEGQGGIGQALRTGRAQIFEIRGNPLFNPWREAVDKLQVSSLLVLPLFHESQVFGVLALYSQIPNCFEEPLLSHLERFADQIMLTISSGKDREQLNLYHQLSRNIKDIILFLDRKGRIFEANEAAIAAYGYSREELLTMNMRDLRDPDTLEEYEREFAAAWTQSLLFETRHKRKDGNIFPVESNPNAGWLNGELVQFDIVRDITARKKAEETLWLEKERAQVTLQSIGDAVITTDTQGNIEFLNQVAEDLTGWTLSLAQGRKLDEVFRIISEIDGEAVENPIARCLKEGRIFGLANHTVLVHKNGHQFAIEDSAAPIRDRSGKIIGAILVFHDVTEKRNLLRQMTHQAHHDSLTGLPNRLLFNDRLHQAITLAQRQNYKLAVLFLDIDRFKLVNDTLGHKMGDHLLQSVTRRLKTVLREGDTISRQGGDEFLIILPRITSDTDAGKVAQKVLSVFTTPFILDNEEVFVTPSIGISIFPGDGMDIETLVKHADTAMYLAKDSGRNNYQYFTWTLNTSAQERLDLENSLRRALANEEFTVYYQPIVSLSTGSIVGAEALLRWNNPRKGLIPPAQFIPIAEDTGLIIPLGEWALRAACTQAHLWREKGHPPLRMAVNLSSRQFRQSNLVQTIKQILTETLLPPQTLELEITESIVAQDVIFTNNILKQLKTMGIGISIDDFGTGFSSLSYLKRFPIDTLKIDKSFVWDINPQNGDEIVSAIIALAQNLKLKVIAEGVETGEQQTFLKQSGCDEIQGFLISQPIPADQFEALLKSGLPPKNLP